AVLSIMPPQAVFHCEGLSPVEGLVITSNTALKVLRMDRRGPAVSPLLLQRSARESQPALIEEFTNLVRARHPDQNGRCVRHGPEPLLAFPQSAFRPALLFDEYSDDVQRCCAKQQETLQLRRPRAREPAGKIAEAVKRSRDGKSGCDQHRARRPEHAEAD